MSQVLIGRYLLGGPGPVAGTPRQVTLRVGHPTTRGRTGQVTVPRQGEIPSVHLDTEFSNIVKEDGPGLNLRAAEVTFPLLLPHRPERHLTYSLGLK